jgi:hypothetical protein
MLLGTVINLVVVFGPLLLFMGLDVWLQSRNLVLARWSYIFPSFWVLISGWVVYSCTMLDNCS